MELFQHMFKKIISALKVNVCSGRLLDQRKQNFAARSRVILIIKGRHRTAAACTCVGREITERLLPSVYFVVRTRSMQDAIWAELMWYRDLFQGGCLCSADGARIY